MTHRTFIDQFAWIRVISCLAIVVLHTVNSGYVYYSDGLSASESVASGIAVNFMMWAVPCFLMVTGALLLDRDRELTASRLFGKYIRRIALALVVFSLLFQILEYLAGESSSIIGEWLSALLQCKGWPHMWYLYLMIGLYLMMPFYKMIADQASDKQIWFLTGLIVLFTSITPIAEIFGYESGFYIPTSVIYPAYLFIGYMLHKKNVSAASAVVCLALSSASIVAVTVAAGGLDGVTTAGLNLSHLTGYASPLVVVLSASIFSLLSRIKMPAGAILRGIDECTFGIYLIHMIGCRLVMKWMGFDPYGYGPFGFAGLAVIFFFTSCLITWVIRRAPVLRSIV